MKVCEHDNCETCPYADCISDIGPRVKEKKKPGRKKIDPELKRQRALAWQREYYQKHKDKYHKYYQEYYQENKEHVKRVQSEYRKKRRRNTHA